jgi:eukaryotic-like serine/threonine-protein kinase
MKIIQGDCGALLFRVDSTTNNFYYFRVCQDGSYAFYDYNNAWSLLSSSQYNSAIHVGLNQSNVVAVVAQGSTLYLYVNHYKVDSISDRTYSHGQIGVAADNALSNHTTEVVYSNAKVWTL